MGKYAWIKEQGDKFSITAMCRFLGVPKSSDYGWLKRCPTAREKADAELTPVIRAIFTKSRATYGIYALWVRDELDSYGLGRIYRPDEGALGD